MPSRRDKVRSRMFSLRADWNHRLRVLLLMPVFFLVGFVVGLFGVSSQLPWNLDPAVVGAVFGGLGIFTGGVLLALVD